MILLIALFISNFLSNISAILMKNKSQVFLTAGIVFLLAMIVLIHDNKLIGSLTLPDNSILLGPNC